MVDLADVKDYVGVTGTGDDALIQSCLQAAQALVTRFNRVWDTDLEEYVVSAAPAEVVERAVLEVTSEMFHKRNAPNGIAQFATFDGPNVARVARDPMVAAYPLLAPWVVSGL